MCGIAFEASSGQRVDEAALGEIVETLRHRGPDGRRTWLSGDRRIGLAHARLSIVDLSDRGNQPMSNEDGTLWLTCNGEVYNHRELREELRGLGHEFRSSSDNEVLLHGYEEWGSFGLLERVRGMFAFALAEPGEGRVFVARDRIGEKPLLYFEDERGVLGASELPALLASGRVPRDVDPLAISYFLSRNLRHVPEPLTIFRAVRKLRPASFMTIENGRIAETGFWWRPSWRRGPADGSALARDVREAVELQHEADVPVGALLSGGVDSTIVVGLSAEDGSTELRTFALGRDDADPELARARRASERFGTSHSETTFRAEQLDRLDALIGQLGEPIALLPLTHADALIGQVHRDGMRVVMTGNGADELLFGYSGVARLRRISLVLRVLERVPGRVLTRLASLPVPAGARLLLRLAALPNRRRKTSLYRDDLQARAELLKEEVRDEARMPGECPVFDPIADLFDGRDYIELSQFLTLMIEDAHSVTISGDLVGMHHSVEVRAPFLDPRVVQTAFSLRIADKAGGLLRPAGKRALKHEFADLLGPAASESKMGFGYSLQEADLIRTDLRSRMEPRLRDGEGLRRYFDMGAVHQMVDEHMAERADHGKLLLSLYAFDVWHERFAAP